MAPLPSAFLFGNVDSEGNLDEEDVFDEETKKALKQVSANFITNEIDMDIKPSSDEELDFDSDNQTLDTGDLTNVVSEFLNQILQMFNALKPDKESTGTMDNQSKLLDNNEKKISENFEQKLVKIERLKRTEKDNSRNHIYKPLAQLLPSIYADMNITDVFPFFTDKHSMRFYQLFSSIYHHEYFPKHHVIAEVENSHNLNFFISQDKNVQHARHRFLNSIPFSAPHSSKSSNMASMLTKNSKDISQWINGPSKLWYKSQNFTVSGFTMPEVNVFKTSSDNITKKQLHRNWMDEIIFDKDEDLQKQVNTMKRKRQIQNAGWVLSSTCKSYAEYCAQNNIQCFISEEIYKEIDNYNTPIYDEVNSQGSKPLNIFNNDEADLVASIKFDDKIIWNVDRKDKTMHIPSSFCLDDSTNSSKKFHKVYRAVIEKAQASSVVDLNPYIAEVGHKTVNLAVKHVHSQSLQPYGSLSYSQDPNADKNKAAIPLATLQNAHIGLKHAVPVERLHPLLFPTFLSVAKLRTFHRHPLRRYSHGPMSQFDVVPVQLIKTSTLGKIDKSITNVTMKDFGALSADKDTLVLFEFLEQYPPFLSQVGMGSIMINYKRIKTSLKTFTHKQWKNENEEQATPALNTDKPNTESQSSMFYGSDVIELPNIPYPGQPPFNKVVKSFENNMYRALTIEHRIRDSDFLLIRDRECLKLREVNAIFSVGQQIPLMEVFTPCSKQAVAFNRDFFKVYVYRLFRIASEDGYRVKMDDIRKAFPNTSENTLRKRLKHCADFRRFGCAANKGGSLVNYWILKDDFTIPDETIVHKMVSPEECCSFYSMITAYQRLRDNGYINKLVSLEEDDQFAVGSNIADDNTSTIITASMEDELLSAPWNTTKTFLECQRGRAIFQVYGHADPTGCGLGFSFVKRVLRPPRDDTFLVNAIKMIKSSSSDRKIEAAIKRLSINEARRLISLYDFVDKDELNQMNKTKVIEKIIANFKSNRNYPLEIPSENIEILSQENDSNQSLAVRKETYNQQQVQFRDDCQKVFEAQMKLLSSVQEISAIEMIQQNSQDDADSRIRSPNDQQILLDTHHIEKMLAEDVEDNSKNDDAIENYLSGSADNSTNIEQSQQATEENFLEESLTQSQTQSVNTQNPLSGQKLVIKRSFRDDRGQVYTRIEQVTDTAIIEAYVRARQPQANLLSGNFILSGRGFKQWHFEQQQQNAFLNGLNTSLTGKKRINPAEPLRKRPKSDKVLSLKCGACGQIGHMKSNKDCPLYQITQAKMLSEKSKRFSNLMNNNASHDSSTDPDVLVKFDGNQVVLSKKLINRTKKVERERKSEETFEFESWFKEEDDLDLSELESSAQSSLLRNYNSMKQPAEFTPYLKQLDFAKQHQQLSDYSSFALFGNNDLQFGSDGDNFSQASSSLLSTSYSEASDEFNNQQCSKLWLELANPRSELGEFVATLLNQLQNHALLWSLMNTASGSAACVLRNFIIMALEHVTSLEFSSPFHNPVDENIAPGYSELISNPICFEDIRKKAENFKYFKFADVEADLQTMHQNSLIYNGLDSPYTLAASKVRDIMLKFFEQNAALASFIEVLKKPEEPSHSTLIYKLHLCHILDLVAASEGGQRLVFSNSENGLSFQELSLKVLNSGPENYLLASDFAHTIKYLTKNFKDSENRLIMSAMNSLMPEIVKFSAICYSHCTNRSQNGQNSQVASDFLSSSNSE